MKKQLLPLLLLSLLPFASSFAQSETSFITTWNTTNQGTSNAKTIIIPTNPSYTYNYKVDWNNDGVFDEFGITGDVQYTFPAPGVYTIRIQGDFPQIYFSNTGDKEKIISIDQWGNFAWSDMSRSFMGCSQLTCPATDVPKLYNVTNMSQMFWGATSFNGYISNWDVSNVSDMSYMFYITTSFNGDISNWDVSNVSNMDWMFAYADSFNSDISNWDVSNVTNMKVMFFNATSFNGDLSNWDVSNVSDMPSMFKGATSFNGDISNWDVSNVTNMSGMFHNATSFNSDLSNWDVSNVTNMDWMFAYADSFNFDISNWDVSNVTNMSGMFHNATSFNGDISNWDVSNVTNMSGMFYSATSFNSDLSNWDVSNVSNMGSMFRSATSFNSDISNWDVSNVTNMSWMFASADSFNSDISNWDVSNVTNMKVMFFNATSFNGDLSNWDVSNVTDMSYMFRDVTSFNGDLSNWDVSNVTDMFWMFYNATSFDADLSNWDISNVANMYGMFNGASSFNANLGSWEISNFSVVQDILHNSGLSTYNYDKTLIGWANSNSSPKNLGSANGLEYCMGKAARDALIASGWIISDDINSCTLTSNQTNNCYTAATLDISSAQNNNNQWLPIADASGNYICSINANGNDLGLTTFDIYLSSTDRSVPGGNFYMNRDIAITPTTQPSSDVCVSFYYSDSELSALIAVDPSISSESDLILSKTPTGCTGSYDGSGLEYGIDAAGSLGPGAVFLEECFSSFSNFHAHGQSSPLPVELLAFEGKAISKYNLLNWTTATELNNKGFEIEKSTDGISWATLGFVDGHGDSGEKINYSFKDLQPSAGTNYYRLKQLDFDGTSQYSNVLSIENRSIEDVNIYPNPGKDVFYVNGVGEGEVIVQNQLGATIYVAPFQNSTLDLSFLQQGVYIVQLKSKNQMTVHRILKH